MAKLDIVVRATRTHVEAQASERVHVVGTEVAQHVGLRMGRYWPAGIVIPTSPGNAPRGDIGPGPMPESGQYRELIETPGRREYRMFPVSSPDTDPRH